MKMPARGDESTKRKDDRYIARYTVHIADDPKHEVVYRKKYKEVEKKLAKACSDAARRNPAAPCPADSADLSSSRVRSARWRPPQLQKPRPTPANMS